MINEDDLTNIFRSLAAPFPNDAIHWRLGATNAKRNGGKPSKGVALAYIDARDVMERLDEVVTPANWQNRYPHANGKTVCEVGLRIEGDWVWKADGAGDTDYEAEKGALSDAFKRAAVRWGVGQYLYTLPAPWVDCDERGQINKDQFAKLDEMHMKAAQAVEWGSRADQNIYRLLVSSLSALAQSPHEVNLWVEDNKGVLSQLPVAMKKSLWEEVQRLISQLEKRDAA